MTENKRFYIDNDGDLYDKQTNKLLMLDFGYGEAIYVKSVVECLNNLHEENQHLQKMNELLIAEVRWNREKTIKDKTRRITPKENKVMKKGLDLSKKIKWSE